MAGLFDRDNEESPPIRMGDVRISFLREAGLCTVSLVYILLFKKAAGDTKNTPKYQLKFRCVYCIFITMEVTKVHARQILDSRGVPTVEVDVTLRDGSFGRAGVPSGASKGSYEAIELRDGDRKHYNGQGVLKAINSVNRLIAPKITGMDSYDQKTIDDILIELDGTENKRDLGANAMVGVSIAVCKAAAVSKKIPLYTYIADISGNKTYRMPRPMILLLEGGKHGNWSTDIQEYMILPKKGVFSSYSRILEAGVSIFHALEEILDKRGYATGVGFEGAFCPQELTANEEAFELIIQAVRKAGFDLPKHFSLALDGAASEFFKSGEYVLPSENHATFTPRQWSERIIQWSKDYPIASLEDMHQEELWEEWSYMTARLGRTIQIVGDDLVTTNVFRIQKAIETKSINAVLIKPNQIGTITETLRAIALAKEAGFVPIMSHRGGETNDNFIADMAIGAGMEEVKFGGPDRGERLAKYNQLLRIEESLM